MGAILWRDMVALEMATNFPEGDGVAIDVKGFDLVRWEAGFFDLASLLELTEEVLGEVGWCYGTV